MEGSWRWVLMESSCGCHQVIHATPSSCLVQHEREGRGLVCALLSLLTAMLQDPESYVYLAAVQGLALLRWGGPQRSEGGTHRTPPSRPAAVRGQGRRQRAEQDLPCVSVLVLVWCGPAVSVRRLRSSPTWSSACEETATKQQPACPPYRDSRCCQAHHHTESHTFFTC